MNPRGLDVPFFSISYSLSPSLDAPLKYKAVENPQDLSDLIMRFPISEAIPENILCRIYKYGAF